MNQENVQDIVGAMITGNTEVGIAVTYDDDAHKLDFNATGVDTFLGLTDTPASYAGEAGKYLKVNAGETDLEFVTISLTTDFLSLTDTPGSYAGQAYDAVRVNAGETALEFVTLGSAQWGHLAAMDQDVASDDDVDFQSVNAGPVESVFTTDEGAGGTPPTVTIKNADHGADDMVPTLLIYQDDYNRDMGDGLGSSIEFQIADNVAVDQVIGHIGFIRDSADNEGKFIVQGGTDGAETFFSIDHTGEGTFAQFPLTPSAAPDADYEVANKKYVDDSMGSDEKVKVDAAATAGYLGAASNDGVLRSSSPLTYTDGGDFVTLSWAHLGIESLADPGADRIMFWDDDETATKWLVANTDLEIDTTNLNVTSTLNTVTGRGATTANAVTVGDLTSGAITTSGTLDMSDNDIIGIQDLFAYDGALNITLASSGTVYVKGTTGIDSYTKLMLHLNGVDGATSTTDSSASAHVVTLVGDAQLDTAQKKFGVSSLLLDGVGDYATLSDDTDWNILGSLANDYTIDFWYRSDDGSVGLETFCGQYASDNVYWTLRYNIGVGGIQFIAANNPNPAPINIAGGTIVDTNWHHIAVVKTATTFKLYLDGVKQAEGTMNNAVDVSAVFGIGARTVPDRYVAGHIDEFRVSVGIARWTANFSVPTSEYGGLSTADLNVQDNLIVGGTIGCGTITVIDGSSINLQEDITFTGATTENLIKIPDNLAVALDITEAANSYLRFRSTDAEEWLALFDTGHLILKANTDDAITAAVDTGALSVYLLPGTYTADAEITIDNDYTHIGGAGHGVKIDSSGGQTFDVIAIGSKNHCVVENLTVIGEPGGASSVAAITMNGGEFNIITDNYIDGSAWKCIELNGNGTDFNIVANNILHDADYANLNLSYADKNVIMGNISHDCGAGYAGFMIYTQAYSNVIVGNISYSDDDHGIYIYASDYSVVMGNAVSEPSQYGIGSQGNYQAVTGNSVFQSGSSGMIAHTADHNTFLGNTIYNAGHDGIRIYNTQYSAFLGNTSYHAGNTYADFHAWGNGADTEYCTFVGNVGREYAGGAEYGWEGTRALRNVIAFNVFLAHDTAGINLDADSNHNIVFGNMLEGEAVARIVNAGSNNIIWDFDTANMKVDTNTDLVVADLLIGDACYIGSESDPDSASIAAGGDWTLTQDLHVEGGIFEVGSDATTRGMLYAYGPATGSGTGGTLLLFPGDDYDNTIGYWRFIANEDDLLIGPSTDVDAFKMVGSDVYLTGGNLYMEAGNVIMSSAKVVDCYTNAGYLKPRRVSAAGAPSGASAEIVMFHDTDDGKVYLIYNDPTVGSKSIELT